MQNILLISFVVIFFSAIFKLFAPAKDKNTRVVYMGEYNPNDTPAPVKQMQRVVNAEKSKEYHYSQARKILNQRQQRKRNKQTNNY